MTKVLSAANNERDEFTLLYMYIYIYILYI